MQLDIAPILQGAPNDCTRKWFLKIENSVLCNGLDRRTFVWNLKFTCLTGALLIVRLENGLERK